MIKTYTRAEMLKLWCARRGILPIFSADAEDATGLRLSIEAEIDAWYSGLLRSAPVELLPVENLTIGTTLRRLASDIIEIRWPERGVRPVSLQFTSSPEPIVIFYSPESDMARLQRFPITRAGSELPVAVLAHGGLRVYGALPAGAQIEELLMVARPEEGAYTLDPSLLKF